MRAKLLITYTTMNKKNNKKAENPEVEQPQVEEPQIEQPVTEQPEVEEPEVEQPEAEQETEQPEAEVESELEPEPEPEDNRPAYVKELMEKGVVIIQGRSRGELDDKLAAIPSDVNFYTGAVGQYMGTGLYRIQVNIKED